MTCADFSPDSKTIACGFADPVGEPLQPGYPDAGEFDLDEPLPAEIDELLGDYATSSEWDVSPEAADGAAMPVGIMAIDTGEAVASFYSEQIHSPAVGIAWTGDGRKILTASEEGTAIWQTRTGQLLHLEKASRPTAIALASDDSRVASSDDLWWNLSELAGDAPLAEGFIAGDDDGYAEDGDRYTDVALSGTTMALGTALGVIEIAGPQGTERYLEGHTRAVTSVSFSADGRLLASKSLDGTVWL